MKKHILLFLLFFAQLLHANETVEELKRQVCQELPSIQGWCSKEKALNFIDLVLEVRPEVCVDIGTFGGRSVLPVASALKFLDHGIVIAIDPWDKIEALRHMDPVEESDHMDWWGKVSFNAIYASYLNLINKHNLGKYCRTIRATSEKAAPDVGTIDILYLDGNHSEVVSVKDVKLYLPKVRSGGYIWLNDSTWTQLQSSIELLQESCDVIRLIDNGNCILFKKR
ncbi:MAG TPA: class I SAM-dependent methyltransferase [Rhabdochlamydiaceae bacterium]|nr:class I SAM-dependent methyltransferase [Rhabdochlamydiaceae bacterium]